jgi:putative flippase GtrA
MTAEPEKPAPAVGPSETSLLSRAGTAVRDIILRLLPASIRRRLETEAGKRFGRFVPVAIAALASSQITLAILAGPVDMTAGKAALIASIVGALVSYLLSRWAWESKGKPDLLRETVPFWLVSFGVWGVLSLTSHYAGAFAKHEHMHHLQKIAIVNGAYLAANCVTFVTRFLIFHYVLFKNQRKAPATVGYGGSAPQADAAVVTEMAASAGLAPAEEARQMALTADRAQREPKS